MNYLAPLALFVFFAGILALQARAKEKRGGELGGPTADQRRVARAFQGTLLVGWGLGISAFVGPDALWPLAVAGGALLVLAGIAVGVDYRGTRSALARSFDNGFFSGRLWGWGLIFIGLCWATLGIAAALT